MNVRFADSRCLLNSDSRCNLLSSYMKNCSIQVEEVLWPSEVKLVIVPSENQHDYHFVGMVQLRMPLYLHRQTHVG